MDYKKLGVKIGLEIHQQLDTKKLFCNCNSILRDDNPKFTIFRKLHPVPGESGIIDAAVAYEKQKDKNFFYQGYDTTCLVELDENPPYDINREALEIALQMSLILHANIFQTTQIMRKEVIDGSNTSGFQRTVLIAKNGFVKIRGKKIKIESISLEEDSARIIKKEKSQTIYRLDRLGIPLLEITTSPDMNSPEEAKEVAIELGEILRSLKIKRGLGVIRQDVNVSIREGVRIELKGVQDLRLFIKIIENELERQERLRIEGKNLESHVRGVYDGFKTKFLRPMPGVHRMYPETDLPLLKISKSIIEKAKSNLPKQIKEIREELKGQGLDLETIKLLLKKRKLEEFKELYQILKKPKLISKLLFSLPKELSFHEKKSLEEVNTKITQEVLVFVLEKLKEKKISEFQIKEVFRKILSGVELKKSMIFEKEKVNLEEEILKVLKEKPGLSMNAYMGLIMNSFKGNKSGNEIMKILKKYLA